MTGEGPDPASKQEPDPALICDDQTPTLTQTLKGNMSTGEAQSTSHNGAQVGCTENGHGHTAKGAGFFALALGSVGVVYGDIGTSPIYAFREALKQAATSGIHREDILGVVSLALWALILVVTVKYVLFLMRADNKGEGGVLSLMALTQRAAGGHSTIIFTLGVLGAALFYGDAIITPAVSVLSAVEGLKTIPSLEKVVQLEEVLAVSFVLLTILFWMQAHGTAKVASLFGPICVLWMVSIGCLGLMHLADDPTILFALSPHYGIGFLFRHGMAGFLVLGAVFLTVTGAEALYADMGHFGRWPIQATWVFFILPALIFNYLGQGAYALKTLSSLKPGEAFPDLDWFFLLAPDFLRAPLVILAAAATVIASQAVITGAFSLTQQAIQLGLLPRMNILRTSETQTGQIYLGSINWMLFIGVVAVMVVFQTSSNLAHAYGLAVTGTMVVTTCLAFVVVTKIWKWKLPLAIAFISPFLIIDLIFFTSNATRIISGGWLPVLIGSLLFLVMATWVRGTQILADKTHRDSVKLTDLIDMLKARPPHRAPGTAIFLTSDIEVAPVALMHNLKHNKVLHEKNVILTVRTADTPRVVESERVKATEINEDFKIVTITYGFMESPNVPKALGIWRRQKDGVKFDIMSTSFFLGRRSVVASANSGMPLWQDKLFIFLMKNAANPTDFFHIPPGRVVELGAQVTV